MNAHFRDKAFLYGRISTIDSGEKAKTEPQLMEARTLPHGDCLRLTFTRLYEGE